MTQPESVDVSAILSEVLAAGEPGGESGQASQAPGAPAPTATPVPGAESAAKTEAPARDQPMPDYVRDALKRAHETERRAQALIKETEAKARAAAPVDKRWTAAAIRADLPGYLRSINIDPGDAGRGLMGEVLGDKGPAEYRALMAKMRDAGKTEEQIDALREEMAAFREHQEAFSREQEYAATRAEYQRGLDTYVSGEIESVYPNAVRAIRADRETAMSEVWSIIREDATAKLRAGAGEPMTPEDALAAFEKRVASYQKWLAPAATVQQKTLANTVSGAVPGAPKPISDIDAAFAEAMDWFNKTQ